MLNLYNISPVDGRYREMTEEVRNCFSEYYLIKNRVIVELEWLKKLATLKEFDIEKHDVKAVEYYLDEKFKEKNIDKYNHLIHFACTSEDINNLAYGIMEKQLLEEIYIPNMNKLIEAIKSKANEYYNIPMLSHTHGQSATPTTVGKEWIIYVYRLNKILDKIKTEKIAGKFNGTVGNFNAHVISYPNIDWIQVSKEFVESFGLECNLFTTQIESHDNISIIFSEIKLLNNIMLDFDNDMWMYISRNYFIQENVKGEVGSSVMPHKINPINFENSMANIKIANGILTSFIDNLQISRMQRDLSDSSILRNIGVAMAHTIIAIKQTIKGIGKVKANDEFLKEELNNTPEILAEAVQTILRKNGYKNAYEILKNMTRGRNITIQEMRDFIQKLEIDETDKNVLLNLKPQDYLGLAEELVKRNEK